MDVIRLLTLDDLHILYYELDMEEEDIDKAERAAATSNVRLKAMSVFNWWKKSNPSKATRRTLLMALEKSELNDPKQKLESEWGENV